jgi:RecA/RadA recombinase
VAAAPRLDELIARLPGTIRRGQAQARTGSFLGTGFADLDRALGGGVPCGALSEVVGGVSSGGTSLAQALVRGVTAREALVAWIDAADAFDPASAAAAGIDLQRLLWVRPPDLPAAFAATDLLLTLGGVALVVLDLRKRAPGRFPRMLAAPQTWIRLARAAARLQTALLVLQRTGSAGSVAALRLELGAGGALWDRRGGAPALLDGLSARVAVTRQRGAAGERRVVLSLA